MNDINTQIQEYLFSQQDLKYRDFHSRLMPTIDKNVIIGVRVPILRKYAKEISKNPDVKCFLCALPHKYYEENNLHAFIIEKIKDYDTCIKMLDAFLPYIDNWATCDSLCPKIFKANKDKLLKKISIWLKSDHTYTMRFGIKMLMTFFLDEDFDIKYPTAISQIRSDEYYIKMMVAWYFATALAKQYDAIIPFIENYTLDTDTHNKAIQKAIESYRITDEQKGYLRTLRIK